MYVFYKANCEGEASSIAQITVKYLCLLPDYGRR